MHALEIDAGGQNVALAPDGAAEDVLAIAFARLSSYLILCRPADQSRSPPPLCWPLAASTPAKNSYSWHLPDGNDLQGQPGVAHGR
jgi:hypothetical protein